MTQTIDTYYVLMIMSIYIMLVHVPCADDRSPYGDVQKLFKLQLMERKLFLGRDKMVANGIIHMVANVVITVSA